MNCLRNFFYSSIILLVNGLTTFAGVDIRLPAEVKGEVNDFITLKAETSGKIVKWIVLDKGLSMFPSDLLKDSKTAIVIGSKEGKYRIMAYTALDNEPSDPVI